ncbi:MAG: AzlC family ABC transporter permease [Anaerolineaceae bacterium]|jgi:4-azaleucine resistance transporter AzlC|nr:MAG: AzlC family ABC transporter permease [Anaerolineaceae bacterium]
MTSPRSELIAGIKAELPITLGVLPFGLIYGVLAVSAGLPPLLAQASSFIVFAGSAQFIGAQLIGASTPALVIWLTTFVVNLRHLLYSTSLAPQTKHLSRPWKWFLAYLLTDEAYVVTALHYEQEQKPPNNKHWFWVGAGLTLWVTWQLSTAAGVFFGTQVPASWSLDFTLALTFIGMVVPLCRQSPNLAAALTAGFVAVLTFAWPYRLGLMAAALAGITAGVLLENTQRRKERLL